MGAWDLPTPTVGLLNHFDDSALLTVKNIWLRQFLGVFGIMISLTYPALACLAGGCGGIFSDLK
jgi:hypothetical protein